MNAWKKRRWLEWMVPFVFFVSTVLFVAGGCNSGGDDNGSPSTSQETEVPVGEDNSDLEKAIQYSVASIANNGENADGFAAMQQALGFMNLSSLNQKSDIEITADFPCGTVTTGNNSIMFQFKGGADCGNITGTVTIPASGGVGTGLQWDVQFDELSNGNCVIDGSVHYSISSGPQSINSTATYDDLTVCGTEYQGSTNFVVGAEDGTLSYNLTAESYHFSEDADVHTSLSYTISGGVGEETHIDGSMTAMIDGKDYSITVTAVDIDGVCGVPVEGTMVVQGPAGESATVDFSGTSCLSPVASYTISGVTYTIDLTEAMTMHASHMMGI